MTKICGIYCIENGVNGKKYIGQSKNIMTRWASHILALKKGIHYNVLLQRAFYKYGLENLNYYILEECEPDNTILDSLEMSYISKLNSGSSEKGYNLTKGGRNPEDLFGKDGSRDKWIICASCGEEIVYLSGTRLKNEICPFCDEQVLPFNPKRSYDLYCRMAHGIGLKELVYKENRSEEEETTIQQFLTYGVSP